jgi:hypothetical protein
LWEALGGCGRLRSFWEVVGDWETGEVEEVVGDWGDCGRLGRLCEAGAVVRGWGGCARLGRLCEAGEVV